MRRSRRGLPSPSSPDQTPPPRSKSRKPWARFLTFDEPEENSQVNVLPHPTESKPEIWNLHLWEKQNEKLLTKAFSATLSARVNAVGLNNDLRNNTREENKENNSFISNSAVEELIREHLHRTPYYRPLTPESDDEPPLLLLDSASNEPTNLLLDEQASYDYAMHSRWISELIESEINDNSYNEQDEDGPSTSARALEILLILQDSVWMSQPNFVLPQKDVTKSVAEKTILQPLSDIRRHELEELRNLEELRQLEELRKLEELREMEELRELGELEDIKELKELEQKSSKPLRKIMRLFRS